MTLQSSGQISFSDLQTEFGNNHPINMAEYASYRTSGSGSLIKLSDFYGAASDFTWDTSSPRTLSSNSFKVSTFEDAGDGGSVTGRISITYGASSASVTVRDLGSTGGGVSDTFTINYSNSSVITSLTANWVLVNSVFSRQGSNTSKVQGFINGTQNFSKNASDSDFDIEGSAVTVTPQVFGGSASNTQNYNITCSTGSIFDVGDPVQRAVFSLASGGRIDLKLVANYSGGSDTFLIRRNRDSSTSPELDMETDYI